MKKRLVPVPGTPYLAQRLLIFCGSAWLLASWILVIGIKRPLVPTTQTWLPGVRLILVMAAIGLVVIWPMAAMATRRLIKPSRTFRESLILLLTAQLITWPSGLVTAWTLSRTSLVTASLTGWGMLAAAVAAWGRQQAQPMHRMAAMACCLIMLLATPTIFLLDEAATWSLPWSPLTNLWSLAGGGIDPPSTGDWINVSILWVLALVAWISVTQAKGCQTRLQTGGSPT